jgi:hypothetical protein
MKKIALLLFSLVALAALFSFIKIKPIAEPVKVAKEKTMTMAERLACAAPTNLSAVKNGTSIVLSWTSSGGVSWSPGGYYNYTGGTSSFGFQTYTYPVSITVPSSTYSITFRVTVTCADGSTATSAPFSKSF